MALSQVNQISINSKLLTAGKKRQYVGLARSAANTRLVFAKQDLLEEIEENEISQELKQGTESNTDSQLISGGSLRAFLGFYPHDNPVQDLKDYFNENIPTITSEPKITDNKRNKIFYKFKVRVPSYTEITEQDIFQLPDTWQNRSFIDVIEKGVSNAVHFVMALLPKTAEKFKEAGSRSGWALQRSNVNSGKTFSPKPYISKIIKDFLEKFES